MKGIKKIGPGRRTRKNPGIRKPKLPPRDANKDGFKITYDGWGNVVFHKVKH